MVEQGIELDTVFHALGDATRRQMLRELTRGERTVGELAQPHAMSLAAAAKHIGVLEGAGLVRKQKRGRTQVCRLQARPLARAYDWLEYYERFWSTRLDTLERLLSDPTPARRSPGKPKGRSR
jgi:DNA-binding transcriptional ArsR family regulator